jgi:hypothetical protein
MFGRYLSEIDWSFLDSLESVEVKNQLFTDMISFGLYYILPEKRLLILPNDHPWFIPTTTTPFGNDTLFKFY